MNLIFSKLIRASFPHLFFTIKSHHLFKVDPKYHRVKYSTLTWYDKYRVEWFRHSHFRYHGQSHLTFCDPIHYSLGKGNGIPLQYSCLDSPMDGGTWWAAVHGVAKSRTRLSDFTFTFHFHALEKEMATQSSVLAWRIPGTGEPGGLPSMGSHRVGHNWSNLAAAAAAAAADYSLLAPLSMGFSKQEYWSELPFPTPGDLPNPGIEPTSLASLALASEFFTTSATFR